MQEYMLSTVDNPFNPFTHFDGWYTWDRAKGYYSLELLGRVVVTSDDLSEEDQRVANESAIDEVVAENVLGVHIKVTASSQPRPSTGTVG